jgi:hypothetical protein
MLRAVLTAALLALSVPDVRAGTPQNATWIENDPAKQTATMNVLAGWNGNNGAWNYNGWHAGGLTVQVPLGWTVLINFTSQDAEVPHSLVVTKHYDPDQMPTELTGQDAALPRAYSKSPNEGMIPGDKDQLRFKAKTAGSYMWACGVPSHMLTGMWINFIVEDGLSGAQILVNEAQIPKDDQPALQ